MESSKEVLTWFSMMALTVVVLGVGIRGCYRESRAAYTLDCNGTTMTGSEPWVFEEGSWRAGSVTTYTPLPGEICRLTRVVK